MDLVNIENRLARILERADAAVFAVMGAGLTDEQRAALTLVVGETRDSIAELIDDMDDMDTARAA